jgi:hypothetical protein
MAPFEPRFARRFFGLEAMSFEAVALEAVPLEAMSLQAVSLEAMSASCVLHEFPFLLFAGGRISSAGEPLT